MAKRKTLFFLIPGFPASEEDSTCLPAQQLLVRTWNRLYPDIDIIIFAFQYPFRPDEYTWHGNRVIPFNGRNKDGLPRRALWLKVWLKMMRLKHKGVIGIFNCWCDECALLGSFFGDRYKIPYYTWICGQDARKSNKLVARIRPKPDSLIAISDFLVREFEHNHSIRPAHMIPIGIDPSLFGKNDIGLRTIDILGVGSLIPLKRFELFIKVIGRLKESFPNINACICGGGPEMERLTQLIRDSGLEKNVHLTGELSHTAVLEKMQQSKLLLHTSSYEGFGAVCIEALYAGAAVLSFTKPMDTAIENWHIIGSEEELLVKARELLTPDIALHRVLPFPIAATATRIMELFPGSKSPG